MTPTPASALLPFSTSLRAMGSPFRLPSGGSSATETSRPPARRTATDRRNRSPPTVSNTRSTGSTASSKRVAASMASCAPSWRTNPRGGVYFIVEPNREQLRSIARLVDAGELRPRFVEIFQLASAREAFARSLEQGRPRKVVLDVACGRPDGT